MFAFDPKLKRMKELFANFDFYRSLQDPELFTQKFLEAQDLQMSGGRTWWEYDKQNKFPLPKDVVSHLTKYLSAKTICILTCVCKAWFLTFRSGNIWSIFYARQFGASAAQIVNPLKIPVECIDWFGAFAGRATISKKVYASVLHCFCVLMFLCCILYRFGPQFITLATWLLNGSLPIALLRHEILRSNINTMDGTMESKTGT
jgi:hypothetical protein